MKKAWEAISGYKTYFVGVLMIALGIATEDNQLILEGLGVMTLRHGIK